MSVTLTALYLQGTVLLIQRVSTQIHHAGSCCGDPERQKVVDISRRIHDKHSLYFDPPLGDTTNRLPHLHVQSPGNCLLVSASCMVTVSWLVPHCHIPGYRLQAYVYIFLVTVSWLPVTLYWHQHTLDWVILQYDNYMDTPISMTSSNVCPPNLVLSSNTVVLLRSSAAPREWTEYWCCSPREHIFFMSYLDSWKVLTLNSVQWMVLSGFS